MVVAPTFSTSFSPTTSRVNLGPVSLGTYPEPTLVDIRASGIIDRYYGYVWYYYSLQGQFDRQIDAGGDNGTQYVHIAFTSPAMGWFKDTQGLPLQGEWSRVAVVQGSGQATWQRPGTGGQCDSPGMPDCYTYTGSFEVSVTPFPADLKLKASRSAIMAGQNVTFTASVTPDSIEHVAVPFKVAEWRWLPDAGGGETVLTQCANQKLCNYAPTVSGTMRATGFANGAATTAEVHIRYLCDPTGDPLLDSLPLIDGLLDAMERSGDPDLPNQASRLEHYLLLNCEEGVCRYEILPGSGPCRGVPQIRFDTIPGLVATGHTHPFNPVNFDPVTGRPEFGNPATDSLPDSCPRSDPTSRDPRGSAPRPSPGDITHVSSLNNEYPHLDLPHYVIDPKNIYAIPGGIMSDKDRRDGTTTVPRGEGGCSF